MCHSPDKIIDEIEKKIVVMVAHIKAGLIKFILFTKILKLILNLNALWQTTVVKNDTISSYYFAKKIEESMKLWNTNWLFFLEQ